MISAEVRASIAASIGSSSAEPQPKVAAGKPASEHGGQLCNRLGQRHAIEPGHQRVLQGCRDCDVVLANAAAIPRGEVRLITALPNSSMNNGTPSARAIISALARLPSTDGSRYAAIPPPGRGRVGRVANASEASYVVTRNYRAVCETSQSEAPETFSGQDHP